MIVAPSGPDCLNLPGPRWADHAPAGLAVCDSIYYSTNFYTERAIAKIRNRSSSKPFYMHLTYQAVRSQLLRVAEPPFPQRQNVVAYNHELRHEADILAVPTPGALAVRRTPGLGAIRGRTGGLLVGHVW